MKTTDIKTFTVYGDPAPKGSWRSMRNPRTGRRIMVADNAAAQTEWKKKMILAARQADVKILSCAVCVTINFQIQRPDCHFLKSGRVKDVAPLYPIHKKDIDKLERAVLDNLTGIAWNDDGQVCQVIKTKIYNSVKLSVCQTTISVMRME